ncbi:hypothetical protein A2851_00125 [Candidatus Kaiserbacteria bacterium RIFCSPHIGHO2_01_FULL_53_29]|uniref:DUF7847 domain-containing protein n=1 Tax=Candidatus Kaiserbacteria bacterium RIFCSPHIGHO2_01_FULL_53_29 TaxID=1798480 RepID=A0A1F6CWE7_9BACT|nr:MAG: hypothetical protein A2851_00125 [Candidatus Kaiserbacteria bacterium RIFCSPHIGHO2_01_FULL_53_29]
MDAFSASASIRFGWETFKKRPWFLIGAFLLVTVISSILSSIINQSTGADAAHPNFFAFLVNMAVNVFVSIGMISFALKAHDHLETAELSDLWRPQFFLNYLGMTVLLFIAAVIGFVLLIVPGFIVLLMYYFAGYFVVDRSLGPINAMKESARITKGHRWQLLGFLGLILLLNILGLLAFIVGLLVTVPVTFLAVAHAYRTLSKMAATA